MTNFTTAFNTLVRVAQLENSGLFEVDIIIPDALNTKAWVEALADKFVFLGFGLLDVKWHKDFEGNNLFSFTGDIQLEVPYNLAGAVALAELVTESAYWDSVKDAPSDEAKLDVIFAAVT